MQPLRTRTAEEAVGRWPGILKRLGVDEKFLRNKHGPCPMCNGKDRYRFDDKAGRGTWFCSHCGSGDAFQLLQGLFGWSFAHAAKEVDSIVGVVSEFRIAQDQSIESKIAALRSVWKSSLPVSSGDPVWKYLHKRVGIDVIPKEIRFHPALWYDQERGKLPAMIARMSYPDGSGASIHRTFLKIDGSKANVPSPKKIMPGKPLNGAAVRLSAVSGYVGIAEGIETALAASKRFSVPVWAATTAGLLKDWQPPVGVKKVLIAGDNDASFTGQAAAYALAFRLKKDGYEVEVQIPDECGKDWADL